VGDKSELFKLILNLEISQPQNYFLSPSHPKKKAQPVTMKYLSTSPSQTRKIGQNLAKKFSKLFKKKALIIGLEGDLGGGKTTFLKGFAKGLKIRKKILSPTFVVMKKFRITKDAKKIAPQFRYFYHIDCYRIKKTKEILALGVGEIISDPQNIVIIEWADRIKGILPKDRISIKFQFINKNTRKIAIDF